MKYPSSAVLRGAKPNRSRSNRLIRCAWSATGLALLLSALFSLTGPSAGAQASNNANLSGLEWRVKDDADIKWDSPHTFLAGEPLYGTTFSSDQTSYSAHLVEGFRYVEVRATAAHSGATIEIGKGTSLQSATSGSPSHAMSLDIGFNTINVKVTAADGMTTKTYVTQIYRQNRAVMYVNGTVADLTVPEGSTATVKVVLVAPAVRSHTFTLTTELKTAEATDIGPLGSITIPAGGTSGSLRFSINEDDDKESDQFELEIDPPYEVDMWLIHGSIILTMRDNDGPNAPRELQASPAADRLRLSWKAPTGSTAPSPDDEHEFIKQRYSLTGYEVQYKEQSAPDQRGTPGDPSSGWTVAAIHFGFQHARTIRAVQPGTTYDLRVRGWNRNVPGAWATAQATTPSGPAKTEPQVLWSTTLTVQQTAHSYGLGCWTWGPRAACAGGLAEHRFTLGGVSYEVRALIRFDEYYSWHVEPVRVYQRSLRLLLNQPLPSNRDLRLRIGGAEYPVSGFGDRTWRDPDFFWRVGDRVPVSLVEVMASSDPSAGATDDPHAALIGQIRQWRSDPCCESNQDHTRRWDRTLMAFGVTVGDTTLEPMTAAEAQGYADRGWSRWTGVAEALRELETPQPIQADPQPLQQPANQAPVVSAALADLVIVHAGGARTVSLAGAFRDPDGDALAISAVSSNTAVATVTVAAGGSSLTLNARSRGAATITVRADDGNGGTASDAFTVTVKAAPLVASALPDLSGLQAGATREVSLAGVFRDPDGDALTVTAGSSNPAAARVAVSADGSSLTLTGVAQGQATISVTARDPDGNQVRDGFSVSVAAAPQPTPQPEPEPPSSELTGVAARYDANSDGAIDVTEWRRAVRDYADGKLSYGEMFQVLTAYRAS